MRAIQAGGKRANSYRFSVSENGVKCKTGTARANQHVNQMAG
jgi:hypothetical protein